MRFLWASAVAGIILTKTALSAGVNKTAHHGVYTAAAERNPALSGEGCAPSPLGTITITQGNLRSAPSPTLAWITGIITEDGHVKGFMARPGGPRRPLEGRLTGDTISAGFIEPDVMCAWQVELKRTP